MMQHILASILNFPNLLWYNFSKDEVFEEEHSQLKILRNLRIFSCQNALVVDFFVNQILY